MSASAAMNDSGLFSGSRRTVWQQREDKIEKWWESIANAILL
jgi:hypothetical protein